MCVSIQAVCRCKRVWHPDDFHCDPLRVDAEGCPIHGAVLRYEIPGDGSTVLYWCESHSSVVPPDDKAAAKRAVSE